MLILTFKGVAQQGNIQRVPSNEIKLNAFNLVAFRAIDLSYEYILDENQSLGVGMLFKLDSLDGKKRTAFEPEISYNRNFSITSYYRRYFSKNMLKAFLQRVF